MIKVSSNVTSNLCNNCIKYSICCHGSILVTIELFVQMLYKHNIYEYDDHIEVRSTEKVDTREDAQTL